MFFFCIISLTYYDFDSEPGFQTNSREHTQEKGNCVYYLFVRSWQKVSNLTLMNHSRLDLLPLPFYIKNYQSIEKYLV